MAGFPGVQADIYNIVLHMQLGTIDRIRPGISYRDVHLGACEILVEDMISLGLMKGNVSDAVEAGAHALFFPHGIGHMMGLDVHDMEDLGDIVGYRKQEKRSSQFGLNFLRLSRPLEPGYVLTVEPGIYFIPALMERWIGEALHKDFINYDKVECFPPLRWDPNRGRCPGNHKLAPAFSDRRFPKPSGKSKAPVALNYELRVTNYELKDTYRLGSDLGCRVFLIRHSSLVIRNWRVLR